MNEIVEFKPNVAANRDAAEGERRLAEARTLAKLALMSVLDYERERLGAAKTLGCRPATLDRIIETARLKVSEANALFPKPCQRWVVGQRLGFNNSDDHGVVIAAGRESYPSRGKQAADHVLILLANGSGTIKEGWGHDAP